MHFDKRYADGGKRVPQGNAGMGKSRRVDNDEIYLFDTGLVHAFDEFGFRVTLEIVEFHAGAACLRCESGIYLVQFLPAIDPGFTCTQEVEIRAMQHQNLSGASSRGRAHAANLRGGCHEGSLPQLAGFCPDLSEIDARMP